MLILIDQYLDTLNDNSTFIEIKAKIEIVRYIP